MFSSRISGSISCPVRGCVWHDNIDVSGGEAEFQAAKQESIGRHQRADHPWMFVEFTQLASGHYECSVCGSVVSDDARHETWHQTARG